MTALPGGPPGRIRAALETISERVGSYIDGQINRLRGNGADGIGGGLRLACLVFLGCPTSVHNRLQFGPTVDSLPDAFAARPGVPPDR